MEKIIPLSLIIGHISAVLFHGLIALGLACLFTSCRTQSNVAEANEQGILIVGNSNEPKGLDPHLVSGVHESNIIRALFEGLCIQHPSEDSGALPGVALKWTPNEGFTEWTFDLNPEAKWSDGVTVTAHDFVFSYRRMLSPDPSWPAKYGEMLYFLKNGQEFNKGEITNFDEVGAKALDDHTLVLTLRGPIPFLPQIIKHYTWTPVPKHVILRHGKINTAFASPWTQPENIVSNGAFQLKTWTTNHMIEVERNPHYWDAKSVSLNGIRYLPISNYYTETRMYGDDQLHLTYSVPSELIPFAKEEYPEELRQEAYVGVRFLRVNTLRKPFTDPKVRRAFALAIDQKAICEKIMQGGQTPASGITPPFGEYNPPAVIQFNPEKARALLAESGYQSTSSFPDISILTTDSETGRREAEALQAMWKEHLDINVRIIQREWTTYLQKQYDADYDLVAGGWIGDYLDPTTFLEMWITDGGNNNTGWGSKTYEKYLNEAENTADITQRMATLAKAEQTILDDTPVLPIYWYTTNYLIRPEVKNWDPLLLNNHPFKFVKIEKD
ncbi:peptide ABC transporter substrate-binding protein [Akkermansiaceae bacterium]|nr:peptide ABC transporter substrate-binding protein [Akkermansiaceae bacterium]MDB4277090.1 peptide ABC transporter substrate-binding protein [bacterium]MDA7877099.1 peptide ABC transporter substrate-binding protein [Akkermansiaceae bacterium]MDB4041453.1 peptide ABC transporter substrate-binding protein [Akkermansiaceae bacterium]MDB4258263.1 peptide ABC transporter substrate-binding protein [Akkermansiaceae bacterium]